jgi:hypothetical protein
VELNADSGGDVSVHKLDDFTSRVSFPALRTAHAANYTCVATNAAGSDAHADSLVVNGEQPLTH